METRTVFCHYSTTAYQSKKQCRILAARNPKKIRDDMIQIKFFFYKLTLMSGEHDVDCCKGINCPRIPQLVTETLVPMISREKLLKHKEAYAKRYGTVVLSMMFGVPESERVAITDKMFKAVEKAVPMRRVDVIVMEVSKQVHRETVDVLMSEAAQDEAAADADTTAAAAAATSTSSDAGMSESAELVNEIVSKKKPIAGDKVGRPRRSAKVPGYLKDFVQNKGKYCVLYC